MIKSLLMLTPLLLAVILHAQPAHVELLRSGENFELRRNGVPFYVKGAGGVDHLDRLAACGANAVRTWGTDQTETVLDQAQKAGLAVCAGLWIEHERHGFNYDDPVAVQAQIEKHKAAVDRFKNHPALLLWSVGNEVEAGAKNTKVWDTIEAVASYIKKTDPHHPVLVVTAHISADTVANIRKHCPSIDLLGCNSYAGLVVLGQDVRRHGWPGAYLVTEWGMDGKWEAPKTSWGAELELTSTEKAVQFAERYRYIRDDRSRCLGSFAFYWGQKQETTATWFSLYTEDGAETEGIEVLESLWTGRKPAAATPQITPLTLDGRPASVGVVATAGAMLHAQFAVTRGEPGGLKVEWQLTSESSDKRHGGDPELRPETMPLPAVAPGADHTRLAFAAPMRPGAYRLCLLVRAPGGKVATANFPFRVTADR